MANSYYLRETTAGSGEWMRCDGPEDCGANEYLVEELGPDNVRVTATQWFHSHGEMSLQGTDAGVENMVACLEALSRLTSDKLEGR